MGSAGKMSKQTRFFEIIEMLRAARAPMLALIYYSESAMIVAWCESRTGLRHFRMDRVVSAQCDVGFFVGLGAALLAQWEVTQKAATVETVDL
jgi:predicted DNA-binding transcriptional regulator YafY